MVTLGCPLKENADSIFFQINHRYQRAALQAPLLNGSIEMGFFLLLVESDSRLQSRLEPLIDPICFDTGFTSSEPRRAEYSQYFVRCLSRKSQNTPTATLKVRVHFGVVWIAHDYKLHRLQVSQAVSFRAHELCWGGDAAKRSLIRGVLSVVVQWMEEVYPSFLPHRKECPADKDDGNSWH